MGGLIQHMHQLPLCQSQIPGKASANVSAQDLRSMKSPVSEGHLHNSQRIDGINGLLNGFSCFSDGDLPLEAF